MQIPEIPKVKSGVITEDWVRANSVTQYPPQETKVPQNNIPPRESSETPHVNTAATTAPLEKDGNSRYTSGGLFAASTPIGETLASYLIETLASPNRQIVGGLATQYLPKWQPETFSGVPTLFQPWKTAYDK